MTHPTTEQRELLELAAQDVVALTITGAKALDPITVICMNHGPGVGRIVIQCYTRAWTAYWGAMGDRTVEQFFMDCHPDYLAGSLAIAMRQAIGDEAYLVRVVTAVQNGLRAAAAIAKGEKA